MADHVLPFTSEWRYDRLVDEYVNSMTSELVRTATKKPLQNEVIDFHNSFTNLIKGELAKQELSPDSDEHEPVKNAVLSTIDMLTLFMHNNPSNNILYFTKPE